MLPNTRAFSLVELSIVLVILGLLVGGVLSGQSLIRAAELRTVPRDIQRYTAAVHTFRDKYFAMPGDMTNATSFWGVAGGTGNNAACYNTVSTDMKTCNGNGNGRWMLDDNVADSSAPEDFRAWQQLSNAALVEGHFTGTRVGSPAQAVPGVNVPAGRVSNSGYTIMSYDPVSDPLWWPGRYDGISFGALTAGYATGGDVLKPEDAWNLDTKMDDGRPATGFARTYISACSTTTSPTTAQYALNVSTISCSLFFAFNPPGNS